MCAAHYRIDGLGLVALGDTSGDVDVVPIAWVKPHAVDLYTVDVDPVLCRIHHLVVHAALAGHTRDALLQVIALGGLVVDLRDHAVALVAEGIQPGDVGEAAGFQRRNIESMSIGPIDPVEWAGVLFVQSSCGGMRRNAGIASSD